MEFVDTHCHIHEASTRKDGDEFVREKWAQAGITEPLPLIKEAAENSVTRLVLVGCTLRDSEMALELAAGQAKCWASPGIHPHEAKDHMGSATQKKFEALLTQPSVVAIGECGLDYFYGHSSKDDQLKVLRFQLELALTHKLPLIFHVRDAFDDFWPVFDEYRGLQGVIHSFSSRQQELEQCLSRGLYVGLNGIMTFTKDADQLAAARALPLEKMLLETDAPFLTPTPYRGTICQPKHVVQTAEFLAGLRDEPLEHIAEVTTQNACNLFALK